MNHMRRKKLFRKKVALRKTTFFLYTFIVIVVTLIITKGITNNYVSKIENELSNTKVEVIQTKDELNYVVNENKKEVEQEKEKNKQQSDENQNLKDKISEYEKSNVALENTLKKISGQGEKPVNYSNTPVVEKSGVEKRGEYLGKWKGTFYTPCSSECGNNLGITASGSPIVAGYSIAADTTRWPIGTILYIEGLGETQVMDTGSAIKGENRFDFAIFDKNLARKLGTGSYDVYLISYGNGKAI